MFNIFKAQKNAIQSAVQTVTASKNIPITAKQIHEDFYNEAKTLLAEVPDELQVKAERFNRLSNAGFTHVKDYDDCRFASLKVGARKAAMNYSVKYPNYKFISYTQVEFLCKKYGLLFSVVRNYIGDIPDKNLNDLTAFKLNPEDNRCICYDDDWYTRKEFGEKYGVKKLNDVIKANGKWIKMFEKGHRNDSGYSPWVVFDEKPINHIMIAATPDMFDMRNKEVKSGYEIVDKDPVVFYNVKDGYLIITAWGDEASIPEIINEKMN